MGEILKDRECIIADCGRKFDVKLGPNGEIPNKYWFKRRRFYFGHQFWFYSSKGKPFDIDNLQLEFRNKFWKIVGYTKLQRWIIDMMDKLYAIIRYRKIEWRECDRCNVE